MIPKDYRKRLEGVSPLKKGDTIGVALDKLDEQTANLDRSQGRTSDVIGLIDACDSRNKEIIKELVPEKQWYQFWK